MFLTKLKVMPVLVMATFACLGIGLLASGLIAAQSQLPQGQGSEKPHQAVLDQRASGQGIKERASFTLPDGIDLVKFSADGKTLVAASHPKDDKPGVFEATVYVWDAVTGHERAKVKWHEVGLKGVALTADGTTLAVGGGGGPPDGVGQVRVWRLPTDQGRSPEELVVLRGVSHIATAVALTADGKLLAAGSDDGMVRLWELPAAKERAILKGHTQRITGLAFTPDGKLLLSASFDKTARLWDVIKGEERITLKGKAELIAMALAGNGKTFATGDKTGTIRLCDVATGKEQARLKTNYDWVCLLELSPDSKLLAWVGLSFKEEEDCLTRLWDVAERRERATIPKTDRYGFTSLAYSPDGKTLATGGYKAVKFWDLSGQ